MRRLPWPSSRRRPTDRCPDDVIVTTHADTALAPYTSASYTPEAKGGTARTATLQRNGAGMVVVVVSKAGTVTAPGVVVGVVC